MNWSIQDNSTPVIENYLALSEEEQLVMRILRERKSPMMIDEISLLSSLNPSKLASLLLNLEFSNLIKSLPGKMFGLK